MSDWISFDIFGESLCRCHNFCSNNIPSTEDFMLGQESLTDFFCLVFRFSQKIRYYRNKGIQLNKIQEKRPKALGHAGFSWILSCWLSYSCAFDNYHVLQAYAQISYEYYLNELESSCAVVETVSSLLKLFKCLQTPHDGVYFR